MLRPTVTEIEIFLHHDKWIRLTDDILAGQEIHDRVTENGVDFWYATKWDAASKRATLVYLEENNRTFDMMEIGDLFWDYDRKTILHRGPEFVTDMVTNRREPIVEGYADTDAESNGWYRNNITGGLATRAELDTLLSDQADEGFLCHYCGMPARSFGFFDEPVCKECGG